MQTTMSQTFENSSCYYGIFSISTLKFYTIRIAVKWFTIGKSLMDHLASHCVKGTMTYSTYYFLVYTHFIFPNCLHFSTSCLIYYYSWAFANVILNGILLSQKQPQAKIKLSGKSKGTSKSALINTTRYQARHPFTLIGCYISCKTVFSYTLCRQIGGFCSST